MTRRALFAAVAGALLLPAYARWKRTHQKREFEALPFSGEARARALGLRSDEEVMEYVDRVIHEFRERERQRQSIG